MDEHTLAGRDVLARLGDQRGAEQLLLAAAQFDSGVFLVGGAVRDLLLGRTPRELDVVVEGDASQFARMLGIPEPIEHPQFGTAVVKLEGARIDVARARRERYPTPGALPEVEPAGVEEDLLRRDFTVNAIAVALDGARIDTAEAMHAVPGALEDLRAGRLRALHDASFIDDPTRLLRLARYAARLGFEIEPHTAELAASAVQARALDTVSGGRIGAELRLALGEPDAVGTFAAMDELGLLTAIHPRMRLDREMIERALELLSGDLSSTGGDHPNDLPAPRGDRPDSLTMAAVVLPMALRAGDDPRAEIAVLLDRLQFAAPDRDRIVAAALAVPRLIDDLPAAEVPSELRAAVTGVPPAGVALAGGVHEPAAEPARRWLTELRYVQLEITGDDLLAAGIREGPEIGRRLNAALDLKLDGALANDREAELAAALEVVV